MSDKETESLMLNDVIDAMGRYVSHTTPELTRDQAWLFGAHVLKAGLISVHSEIVAWEGITKFNASYN